MIYMSAVVDGFSAVMLVKNVSVWRGSFTAAE